MKKISYLLILAFALFSCDSTGEEPQTPEVPLDSFDRGAMLVSYADQFIIPGYTQLNADLSALKSSKDQYLAGSSSLEDLQEAWKSAYMSWQKVEVFNIGPAESELMTFQMNVYPTNVTDIESNIASGSYDLTAVNNNDAVGFPAVEYLLFESETLSEDATRQYLSDLVDRMSDLTSQVLTEWTSSYRETFVNSTGNTASSALNLFVNDLIFYTEKGFRANKVGIPAGIFSGGPLPDRVESLYAQAYSKDFSLEAINTIQNLFSSGNNSLEDYLIYLGNQELATDITEQINDAKSALNGLDNSFYDQVVNDNTQMLRTYDEIQKIVVLLKVDLLQELNIAVDYVDADGD